MARRIVVSAWLGLALAALFFYPLAAEFDADIYYLQWQARDLVEAAVAVTALALVLSGIIFAVWRRSSRAATAVLLAVAALPLASFAAGVSRQLPFDDTIRAAWEYRPVVIAVLLAAAGGVGLAFLAWPQLFGRWFRRLLVLVSPVSLVVLGGFITSAARTDMVLAFERAPRAAAAVQRACTPVLALLFDELSFSYLYDDAGRLRPEFPEFSRFGRASTHYLSVRAPGSETLAALPSLLAARRVERIEVADEGLMEFMGAGRLVPFSAAEPDGLFATAQRLGLSTEMAGYYLAYCDLLADLVDTCQSLSLYNVSSTGGRFSPANPVLTTLILWPRQFPFGLLKSPAFARHQRQMVEELVAFARRPMGVDPPVFRFIHFSVPHLPFVFDAEGYDPPFDPLQTATDEGYVRQVRYVDRVLGDLLEGMRRAGTYDRTAIIVFADHGYRFGGRERDPLHVPFVVKMAGQQSQANERAAFQGEVLLKQVLQGACASG